MIINPADFTEQYVTQHIEYGGSNMPARIIKVRPINSIVRWQRNSTRENLNGQWLYIDNSDNGYNSPPFELNETKIDFERDKRKAKIVIVKNGMIDNNDR